MGLGQRGEEAIAMVERDKSKILHMALGPHADVTPGQRIPRAEAQKAPELSLEGANGEYIAVCLDLDAPLVSFPILGPILHWIQSGLTPTAGAEGLTVLQAADTPFTCDYAAPGPPPGASPHRYVFMLYAQPPGYDLAKFAPPNGQKAGISKRIRYNIENFEKEAGLGPVIAANYFRSN